MSDPFAARPKLLLHKGQLAVLKDRARMKVVVAGRRWGKSMMARTAMIKAAAARRKMRVYYVAPTYRMAKQIMWQELLDSIPRKWVKSIHRTDLVIWLRNGSFIKLCGADNPDTLRGIAIDYLVLDEFQDMHEDVWLKVLRPTLVSTGGSALFIGTPKAFNLLYELYMKGQKPDLQRRGQWRSWQYPTITSPFIPAAEIEAARADMDEKSFKQEFLASFEAMSGRVYHAFDRKVHLGDHPFNPLLPIWVGQDFNIDPMSSVILQPQPDGTVWAVDEIIMFNSNTEELAEELSKRYWRQLGQVHIFPDPAGANRSASRGESDLDILRQAGFGKIFYRKKHPPVADRINAVNRLLRTADGTVRLRIDRRCKHLIDALEQVIYKKGTRVVDKSAGLEHPADALGYPIELRFPVREVKILGVSI
ncbi:terminase large subunit domain-containing protein [Inquilinus sp. OTU3971]|uniref:terminase large subunit domain-containing protein n=1 Tax=Inquilinus sp. OTU3971 TaxID=3043855 RepID=UPI00313A9FDD